MNHTEVQVRMTKITSLCKRISLQDPISPDTLYPVNFLCPNGTIFNQELFNCDWWYVS